MLYYTLLYYTFILCCAMLYYTIPYYAILYHTIIYQTMLDYTGLYCTILYYTILRYTILSVHVGAHAPCGDMQLETCSQRVTGAARVTRRMSQGRMSPRSFQLFGQRFKNTFKPLGRVRKGLNKCLKVWPTILNDVFNLRGENPNA